MVVRITTGNSMSSEFEMLFKLCHLNFTNDDQGHIVDSSFLSQKRKKNKIEIRMSILYLYIRSLCPEKHNSFFKRSFKIIGAEHLISGIMNEKKEKPYMESSGINFIMVVY